MDLRFTPEENAFRDEVRAFFKENLPDHIRKKAAEGIRYVKDDIVTWQRILNKKGWAVPHWPKEWGGTGWSPVQLYIFKEEMQQAPAPEPLPFGTMMLARCSSRSAAKTRRRDFCRASPTSTTGGARASPSRARAPTSPR